MMRAPIVHAINVKGHIFMYATYHPVHHSFVIVNLDVPTGSQTSMLLLLTYIYFVLNNLLILWPF